eukprot:150344_1
MMCAACIPFVKIYTAAGGQFKCSGNLINIKQDITSFHKRLPLHPEDVPFVFVGRKRKDKMGHNETKIFKVRPNVIRRLLEGLKRNQVPPYADIEIDYDYINSLEEGIPTGINHIEVVEPPSQEEVKYANYESTDDMDANDSESNDESPNIIDDNHNESANIIVMNPQHVALSSMDNRNESANAMDVSLSSMDNRNVSANVMNVSLSSMNGSVSDQVMDVSLSSINHNVMNDAQSDEVPANCLIESLWAEAS